MNRNLSHSLVALIAMVTLFFTGCAYDVPELAGEADHPQIYVAPESAAINKKMRPIIIRILDKNNQAVLDAEGEVTVSIGNNVSPNPGTLSGTKTVQISEGMAIFNDLKLNRVGTGYTLKFDTPVGTPTSAPFEIADPDDAQESIRSYSGRNLAFKNVPTLIYAEFVSSKGNPLAGVDGSIDITVTTPSATDYSITADVTNGRSVITLDSFTELGTYTLTTSGTTGPAVTLNLDNLDGFVSQTGFSYVDNIREENTLKIGTEDFASDNGFASIYAGKGNRPLKFPIAGKIYNAIHISSNGFIIPGTTDQIPFGLNSMPTNIFLPESTLNVGTILAPYWDDLVTDGNIFASLSSDPPGKRTLVISWAGATHATNPDAEGNHFQIILSENGDPPVVQFDTVNGLGPGLNKGASATFGYQTEARITELGNTVSTGLGGSYNQDNVLDNHQSYILFFQ